RKYSTEPVSTPCKCQQLLGEINWVRSGLGITNYKLAPLFNLLRGDRDIKSPRTLTLEAQKALEKITEAFQKKPSTWLC
ncbi:POK25 protein, partial [Erythrocercus mccallii]|nr:POK25 protein [Erythrocercus mccallii]